MAQTTLNTQQFNGVQRDDLDITTSTKSVIAKVIQGTGMSISSTGADSGTGDVTVNLDINGLTVDATPDYAADYLATYDASASTHKKILLPVLASGTYTPTLTNTSNIDSSTASVFQYIRVGSVVTVSGEVTVNATTATTTTVLGVSLPVASNFATNAECVGVGASAQIPVITAQIGGDITNDRASVSWRVGSDVGDVKYYLTFTYSII